jgi:hypothetical protein
VTESKSLQIAPQGAAAPSPEHKRFYNLIRQIEKVRQSLVGWRDQILRFRQAYTDQLIPLQDSIVAIVRERLFALDRALEQRCWSRAERDMMRNLLCDAAAGLLETRPDAALKELFDKHSRVDFDTEKQRELAVLSELTQMFTGVDLGDTSSIRSEEDLVERVSEQMAAREEARRAQQDARAQRRGKSKSAAQQRREDETKRVTQSVREIFRKLVSALHPDREPDPAQREAKTTLMQKVNQAYEANDLLTLLEVQLQIEQVSPDQIHDTDPQRLKHYNKVLAEQLTSLKLEVEQLKTDLHMEFDVPLRGSDPRQITSLVKQQEHLLRAELAREKRELSLLADVAATKQWLRRRREEERRAERDDDFF